MAEGTLGAQDASQMLPRSSTDVSKIITLVTNRVPMAPHAMILCHNEAQHLHEAFQVPPEPQRLHFRLRNIKENNI